MGRLLHVLLSVTLAFVFGHRLNRDRIKKRQALNQQRLKHDAAIGAHRDEDSQTKHGSAEHGGQALATVGLEVDRDMRIAASAASRSNSAHSITAAFKEPDKQGDDIPIESSGSTDMEDSASQVEPPSIAASAKAKLLSRDPDVKLTQEESDDLRARMDRLIAFLEKKDANASRALTKAGESDSQVSRVAKARPTVYSETLEYLCANAYTGNVEEFLLDISGNYIRQTEKREAHDWFVKEGSPPVRLYYDLLKEGGFWVFTTPPRSQGGAKTLAYHKADEEDDDSPAWLEDWNFPGFDGSVAKLSVKTSAAGAIGEVLFVQAN